MGALLLFGYLLPVLVWANPTPHSLPRPCKPLPGDSDWPSAGQWQALNESVSGRLAIPTPPGALCHPDWPTYDNASCAALKTNWTSSSWQESNPWTSMYNDDTCLPSADTPCSPRGYPGYVIEAQTIADAQAGIRFAAQTGVRLIIKGTGHDVPGRSAGAGALSIWTHRFRGVDIAMDDPLALEEGAPASVKLGAGMIWGDIYEKVAAAGLTVVGGADPHVGVGGWMQGAGHGPLSSLYGLGADQVLEMEVVTADGAYRVISATSHPDLFWAMRGGGPSTYAVMLSMTVKAYPRLAGCQYGFQYNTTASSETFWRLAAQFSSQVPELSDKGAMGYYYPNQGSPNTSASLTGSLLFPNKSLPEVKALMAPFDAALRSPPWPHGPIVGGAKITPFHNFLQFWHANNPAEAVGTNTRFASWLLDRPALTSNTSHLAHTLREISPAEATWIGHVVAGPGVAHAQPAGGGDAVLPAWRRAYVHLVQARGWPSLNVTQRTAATTALRNTVQPALRRLAPLSGAYASEADPSNARWKGDYFGENYARLLRVKHEWDPRGIFWCKPCVGFDEWDIRSLEDDGENVLERGIGQGQVRLCWKGWGDREGGGVGTA